MAAGTHEFASKGTPGTDNPLSYGSVEEYVLAEEEKRRAEQEQEEEAEPDQATFALRERLDLVEKGVRVRWWFGAGSAESERTEQILDMEQAHLAGLDGLDSENGAGRDAKGGQDAWQEATNVAEQIAVMLSEANRQ